MTNIEIVRDALDRLVRALEFPEGVAFSWRCQRCEPSTPPEIDKPCPLHHAKDVLASIVTTKVTAPELNAVEERRLIAWRGWVDGTTGSLEQQQILREDVPALIAEVRELREKLTAGATL